MGVGGKEISPSDARNFAISCGGRPEVEGERAVPIRVIVNRSPLAYQIAHLNAVFRSD